MGVVERQAGKAPLQAQASQPNTCSQSQPWNYTKGRLRCSRIPNRGHRGSRFRANRASVATRARPASPTLNRVTPSYQMCDSKTPFPNPRSRPGTPFAGGHRSGEVSQNPRTPPLHPISSQTISSQTRFSQQTELVRRAHPQNPLKAYTRNYN